jgi:hypothetical protein
MTEATKTVRDIIKAAGGPVAIASASEATDSKISVEAVYKWPAIGIPDRHWPLIMPLANATADEMLAANIAARSPDQIAS